MSARDVVADVLMSDGCGDSDQCDATAARVLSALAAAGCLVAIDPEPMTFGRAKERGVYYEPGQLGYRMGYMQGWNACRTAMLAIGEARR